MPLHHPSISIPTIIRSILLTAAVLILVQPPSSATADQPSATPSPSRPGFLEIAVDPNSSAEQKRTVAAILEFARETDPETAYAKLKESDVITLYGGGEDGVSDLSPLSEFTGLKTLVLFNHRITDLTPLEPLENLETLRLEVNRIRDLGPLSKLRKLRSLQITHNQISDLRPLAYLDRLETLTLSNNQIADITPLRGLKNLRDLDLSQNRVADLRIFSEMNVTTLRLSDNGISDIAALRDMNQETRGFIALVLANNRIRDISPLAGLDKVTSLDLSNNQVTDIDAMLKEAPMALKWLNLEGNQLTRVPDFRGVGIRHVNLKRNPITDYADLILQKNENPNLDISDDPEFTHAFERSFPPIEELKDSPLLGEWRTDPIESEWGEVVLGLGFRENGIFYTRILAAEPGDGEDSQGFTIDGRFAVRDALLVMTIRNDTTECHFEVKDNQLILNQQDRKTTYRKLKK